MKYQLIVGVLLLVVAGLFARYKVFDDKIELKYSLSEKIQSDFIDNSDESGVQQLTIKNSGDVLINSIVVKINAPIQDVKIIKFRYIDSVSFSKTENHLEILYPELPPLAEIIVLLKSTDSGISKNNIEIFHSKGIAKEAFSDNDSYSKISSMIILIFYFILVLFGLKNTLGSILETKAKYSSKDTLKRSKPWYIDETKWSEIRKIAISNFIERENVAVIEKSEIFQLLNSEKKSYLSEEEWNDLIEKAENKIRLIITENIYKSYYYSSYEELSSLKKPRNISYNNWKKISDEVSKAYCIHKIKDVILYGNQNSVIEILKDKKPDLVTDEDWRNITKIFKSFYASSIIEMGFTRAVYGNYIDNTNLDFLEDNRKKEIQDLFSIIKESHELKDYYKKMLQLLNQMLIWKEIPDKPDFIITDDWQCIEDFFHQIIETEKVATENLIEAKNIEREFKPLKEKVLKQLEIIDNLLNDPESIDKIEFYAIPFAKGNWENIQKVIKILREV